MLVIPAIWETEIRSIVIQGQLEQIVFEASSLK
jgi:hypothetical protein